MSTEEKLRSDLTLLADKCERDAIEYKTMARTLARTAWLLRDALGTAAPACPDNSDLQEQPVASGWRS